MEPGLLSLKWNNHKPTFFKVLSTLRKNEMYTDATLACEGQFFPVHKLVLSTCSDYFSLVFEKTACKSPVIILKDMTARDLQSLLDYMYVGEVEVCQSDLPSLVKAAENLQIRGLATPDQDDEEDSPKRKADSYLENSTPQTKKRKRDKPKLKKDRHSTAKIISQMAEPLVKIEKQEHEGEVADPSEGFSRDVDHFNASMTSHDLEAEDEMDRLYSESAEVSQDDSHTWNETDSGADLNPQEFLMQNEELSNESLQQKRLRNGPFQCPICLKTISTRYNLARHVRIHTGEKPYACQQCPYRSVSSSDVSKHELIHEKEKERGKDKSSTPGDSNDGLDETDTRKDKNL